MGSDLGTSWQATPLNPRGNGRLGMGEATARELLSELLAEVTQCTYSKEVEIRPISYPDVAGVVRHHLPDRITTNFCVRRGRVEVFQLMCLEQRASG